VPFEELAGYKAIHKIHHPLRQGGKINELALGFGGWIGALKAMAVSLGITLDKTDRELQDQVLAWRAASPAVVEFWGGQTRDFGRDGGCLFGLEGAVIQALTTPGQFFPVMRLDGTYSGISYVFKDDALYCQLPSGRYLTYHRPRLRETGNWRGYEISYEGYNTNPKAGATGWIRMTIYSGKLAENVVQATARDILRHAIINCERAGYPVVIHVYDELLCEVPQGIGSVEGLEAIMRDVPTWAKGWPIDAAGGWRGTRYRKA
jgi:DNA polymerase